MLKLNFIDFVSFLMVYHIFQVFFIFFLPILGWRGLNMKKFRLNKTSFHNLFL